MAPRVAKRMKKRRELDALVASGKAPASSYCSSDDGPDGGLLFDEARPRRRKPPRGLRALKAGCGACVVVGLLLAAAALTWLLADVRAQVAALRAHLDRVSSSCDGVSNDLFQCRSSSRQLQLNQTHLAARIENITAFLANMSNQLNSVSEGLQEVQKRVQEAPQLMTIPKDLKDLSNSVADLGSQIGEMKSTSKQLQQQTGVITSNLTHLETFISEVNSTLQSRQLVGASKAGREAEKSKLEEQEKWARDLATLTKNVSQINASLSNKLEWIKDDLSKDHKLIEALQDLGQNLSAKVTTLDANSNQMSDQQKHNMATFNTQLAGTTSQLSEFDTKVGRLQEQYRVLLTKQEYVLNRLDRLDAQPASPLPSSTESVVSVSKSPVSSALPSTEKAKDSPAVP
ncbi:uncharacterized protein LOC132195230 isoform X2 [Neocloeon triangulifer]|uniref:uncharacterized protein LOC132195230 isoform X2 n=1 Tax=Neocloeon triangulifer TaxID=2078957 RepID=UPI00286EF4AA|nr:uncharacterized protein LOC132195230 isoform X2 [Neocloeon triangulifer]